jgi:hypothetical protein
VIQKMKNIILLIIFSLPLLVFGKPYSAEIKEYNGAPSLFINNEVTYPTAFRTWPLKPEDEKNQYSAMSKAGVKIYFTYIDFGKFWTGKNQYDYKEIDRKIELVTKNVPDAWIIPVISIHHDMFWWYYKNIDERTIDGLAPNQKAPVQGAYACISFASDKFKQESAVAVKKILKYIEKHKAASQVIGYQVGHGAYEEWIPWGLNKRKFIDFNPAFITQFREWLEKKYINEKALQVSWNNPKVTFSNAMPFLGKNIKEQDPEHGRFINPAKKQQLLDNREFLSELITDTALFYAGIIKKETNGKALVGMYSGANYQYQHFIRILESKDIDFLCSSTGYGDRAENGVTYDQCFTLESVKAHNKIYLHDADIRTYLFPSYKTAYFGGSTDFGRLNNPYDTVMVLRREWGAMLVHGFGIVWLNIARNPMFYCPIIMRDICRMSEIGKASMAFDRSSNAEIAVIARQRPSHYGYFYGAGTVRSQLYRVGAPVDIYSNEDISRIPKNKYKLIVVVFSQLLTDKERKALDTLKGNGATILWSLASGYLTEKGFSLEAMKALTGFDFQKNTGDLPEFKLSNYFFKYLKPNHDFSVRGMIMGQHGAAYFSVKQSSELKTLGKTDQGNIVFAKKKFSDWTSVYYPGFVVPGAIIREIAAQAGVNIYCNSDDGFYANRNFIMLSSSENGGKKTLELPEKSYVYDVFKNKIIAENKRSFTVNQTPHATDVYFVGSQKELDKFKSLYTLKGCGVKDWTWTPPVGENVTFTYFDKPGILDVMKGKSINVKFRLSANTEDVEGVLAADLPNGWTCEKAEKIKLEKGQICFPVLKIIVPAKTKDGRYKLNAKFMNKQIPVQLEVSSFTYLSDLSWEKAVSGWKQVLRDKSVSGKDITLNGKKYRKGIGCHAESELVYDLNGNWKRLEAVIGVSDNAGKGRDGRASAVFEVYGDGKKLYSSGKMFGYGKAKKIDLDVTGVKTLRLLTLDGGDGKSADHTEWADAKLYQ